MALFGKLINKIKADPHLQILVIVLIIALFFRTYNGLKWFDFAHDGDLYSWIVKDIVVDHHLRLIGQLTSAPGIFIGPFFYYLLIPFFLLTRMDPAGAIIPITTIGVLTVFSYYYVFARLFNKTVGLISSFLYAALLENIYFDRRVVPSTPTNIWLVWYFFTIIMITRGQYAVFPLLGLLIGLIWHIHIALAPTLVVVPIAMLLSKKLPSRKQIYHFLTALTIPSIPLVLFEARHNFSQTASFINNFFVSQGGGTGIEKLQLVLIKLTSNLIRLLFYPQEIRVNHSLILAALMISPILIFKKRVINKRELIIFYSWITFVILFYSISSIVLSEYYLASVEIVFLAIVSSLLYLLYKSSVIGKYITLLAMLFILLNSWLNIGNLYSFRKGYVERKAAAAFIKEDSVEKGFPCVSISYITSPGENVGFRQFFWLDNLKTTKVQADSVTYSIVNPPEFANGDKEKHFGQIKVIVPDKLPTRERINKSCEGGNTNLTDSLFGFTK